MKFSTWQLVVIMAILFAAIIATHVYAPTAAATVMSMAVALFSTFFLQKSEPAPKADGE